MAVFNTNQVRQLYAVKSIKTAATDVKNVGDIALVAPEDKDYIYFQYMGNGGMLRSDIIKKDSVCWAKHTEATDDIRYLKAVKVSLDPSYLIDTNKVLPGQDYILRIVFRQFAGMSDEDVYIKYGMVHGVRDMTEEQFYNKLVKSFEMNFKRELTPLVGFAVIPSTDDEQGGVLIYELPQEWTLGVKAQEPVYFDVIPSTVTYDGEDVQWANADPKSDGCTIKEVNITEFTDQLPTNFIPVIPNSSRLADLEYFCMGERGDIYRNVGWPNVIPTKYILDGNDTDGYDVIDLHFYFVGGGENPQKSEKDITIVGSSLGDLKTQIANAGISIE